MHQTISLALSALNQQLTFRHFRPGVEVSWLYGEAEDQGPGAAFLRYAPGASVPRHRHQGYEHILVLEGAQEDERGSYAAGSLVVNPPGTEHAVVSPQGCLVLAIWSERVLFVSPP